MVGREPRKTVLLAMHAFKCAQICLVRQLLSKPQTIGLASRLSGVVSTVGNTGVFGIDNTRMQTRTKREKCYNIVKRGSYSRITWVISVFRIIKATVTAVLHEDGITPYDIPNNTTTDIGIVFNKELFVALCTSFGNKLESLTLVTRLCHYIDEH